MSDDDRGSGCGCPYLVAWTVVFIVIFLGNALMPLTARWPAVSGCLWVYDQLSSPPVRFG